MTAFDNIKTNNWPSTFNEFEDFLVLKMPLNDNASLTESLPVVAGSKELFPKRTLTNNGVDLQEARYVANVKLHTYIYNTPGTLTVNGNTVPRGSDPNGDVTFTVAVNGGLSSIAWSYDSTNGPYCYMRGIEVDLGDGNGYQLIQDGAFGVSAYSSLISGTVDSSYPLSNLFGGTIGSGYTNGTRHVSPGTLTLNLSSVFPAKKHYDNNAVFADNFIDLPASSDLYLGTDDFTVEMYFRTDTYSSDGKYRRLFMLDGPSGNANGNLQFILDSGSTGTAGTAYMYTLGSLEARGTTNHSDDVWHHGAITRSNGTAYLWIDGIQLASQAYTVDVGALNSNSPRVRIGAYSTSQGRLQGEIQDLRVYKGVAKYTANFTPPGAILG